MAHRLDGVHGLPRLGDGHGQGLLGDHGVAVAELVGEFDLHRNAAPVLNGVLGDVPGIGGGPAGDDNDLVDAAQHGGFNAHLVELEFTALIDAPAQGSPFSSAIQGAATARAAALTTSGASTGPWTTRT